MFENRNVSFIYNYSQKYSAIDEIKKKQKKGWYQNGGCGNRDVVIHKYATNFCLFYFIFIVPL